MSKFLFKKQTSENICYYCGKSASVKALILNVFGTLSDEFVCPDCCKLYDIELGFQTHSGD